MAAGARPLTDAERQQRIEARLKHGALSPSAAGPRWALHYRLRLRRVQNALRRARRHRNGSGCCRQGETPTCGETTLEQRALCEQIARYDAWIELADEWLDRQNHPLFVDPATGSLHAVVERRDGWMAERAKLLDRLAGTLRDLGALDLRGARA